MQQRHVAAGRTAGARTEPHSRAGWATHVKMFVHGNNFCEPSPCTFNCMGAQLTETNIQTRLPTFVLIFPFIASIIVFDKSRAVLTFRLSTEQYHSKLQLAPHMSHCYPFGRPNPPVENAPKGGFRDAEPPRRRSFCMFRDADGCEECTGKLRNAGIVIVSESQRGLLQRTKNKTLTCCGLEHDCKTCDALWLRLKAEKPSGLADSRI